MRPQTETGGFEQHWGHIHSRLVASVTKTGVDTPGPWRLQCGHLSLRCTHSWCHSDCTAKTSKITQTKLLPLLDSDCGVNTAGGHKGLAADVPVVKHWDVDAARVKPTGSIWGHRDKGRMCLWSHILACGHTFVHTVWDVDTHGFMQTGVQLLLG